jgi:uncharacterized membrane protein YfcA
VTLVAFAVATAVVAGVALGAPAGPREPELPSYAIPNIVAIVMCAVAFMIPCKLFRRS